jgi:hypothetical protein
VPVGTFRSTAEDSSSPYRKPLPITEAFFATVVTQPFSQDRSKLERKKLIVMKYVSYFNILYFYFHILYFFLSIVMNYVLEFICII